jgi:hypothetical protein
VHAELGMTVNPAHTPGLQESAQRLGLSVRRYWNGHLHKSDLVSAHFPACASIGHFLAACSCILTPRRSPPLSSLQPLSTRPCMPPQHLRREIPEVEGAWRGPSRPAPRLRRKRAGADCALSLLNHWYL